MGNGKKSPGARWTREELDARLAEKGLKVSNLPTNLPPEQQTVLTSKQANQALGRLASGVMNATEKAYADELEARKKSGEILDYKFEPITLKIAKDTRYTPDFFVMMADCTLEFHEVKGHWQDDAKVKIKVAAAQFPMFAFNAIFKNTKKEGGGFRSEYFAPQ